MKMPDELYECKHRDGCEIPPCKHHMTVFTIVDRKKGLEQFRPSAWPIMLAELMANTDDKVTRCAKCLIPGHEPDGSRSVRMNGAIAECAPHIHEQVIEFAASNGLTVEKSQIVDC